MIIVWFVNKWLGDIISLNIKLTPNAILIIKCLFLNAFCSHFLVF